MSRAGGDSSHQTYRAYSPYHTKSNSPEKRHAHAVGLLDRKISIPQVCEHNDLPSPVKHAERMALLQQLVDVPLVQRSTDDKDHVVDHVAVAAGMAIRLGNRSSMSGNSRAGRIMDKQGKSFAEAPALGAQQFKSFHKGTTSC